MRTEAAFFPVGKGDVLEVIEETVQESDDEAEEADLKKAKAKTAVLADEAENGILELQRLLAKTKSGTATLSEKDRLKSLNSKLSVLKRDIEDAKTVEKETELTLLRSTKRRKIAEIKLALKEKDIRRALSGVEAAESVDIAFIIDSTGSMGPYISSVKDSIRSIVERIRTTNQSMNLRLAIVGYRDISDSPRFEVLDFVTSMDEFKGFLSKIHATGGGDAPEDMAGAIKEANKLSWNQPTKLAFIIADAPCHGTQFNSGVNDTYPGGTPGIDIVQELIDLQQKDLQGTMSITFGKITKETDVMVSQFQRSGILIDEVGIEETSKLTKTVTASVRKSIFKTVTAAGKPGASVAFAATINIKDLLKGGRRTSASLKEYTISPSNPSAIEWKKQPIRSVKVYRNVEIKSVSDLQEPIKMGVLRYVASAGKSGKRRTDKTFNTTMSMRRAPSPFAEGEIRLAYHGQLAKEEKDLGSKDHKMVMKSFKHLGEGVNDRDQYLKQMEVSAIAHFLAKEFNSSSAKPSHCCDVRILPVCVVEEEDEKNEKTGNRRFCTEALLPSGGTDFAKYSNNTGYWDEDNINETLLRFTKYTYDITRGYIIVTDLQGVCEGNRFHLTDPVILCKDISRFGNTNLGEKFMKKCIESTTAHLNENGWN